MLIKAAPVVLVPKGWYSFSLHKIIFTIMSTNHHLLLCTFCTFFQTPTSVPMKFGNGLGSSPKKVWWCKYLSILVLTMLIKAAPVVLVPKGWYACSLHKIMSTIMSINHHLLLCTLFNFCAWFWNNDMNKYVYYFHVKNGYVFYELCMLALMFGAINYIVRQIDFVLLSIHQGSQAVPGHWQ